MDSHSVITVGGRCLKPRFEDLPLLPRLGRHLLQLVVSLEEVETSPPPGLRRCGAHLLPQREVHPQALRRYNGPARMELERPTQFGSGVLTG